MSIERLPKGVGGIVSVEGGIQGQNTDPANKAGAIAQQTLQDQNQVFEEKPINASLGGKILGALQGLWQKICELAQWIFGGFQSNELPVNHESAESCKEKSIEIEGYSPKNSTEKKGDTTDLTEEQEDKFHDAREEQPSILVEAVSKGFEKCRGGFKTILEASMSITEKGVLPVIDAFLEYIVPTNNQEFRKAPEDFDCDPNNFEPDKTNGSEESSESKKNKEGFFSGFWKSYQKESQMTDSNASFAPNAFSDTEPELSDSESEFSDSESEPISNNRPTDSQNLGKLNESMDFKELGTKLNCLSVQSDRESTPLRDEKVNHNLKVDSEPKKEINPEKTARTIFQAFSSNNKNFPEKNGDFWETSVQGTKQTHTFNITKVGGEADISHMLSFKGKWRNETKERVIYYDSNNGQTLIISTQTYHYKIKKVK